MEIIINGEKISTNSATLEDLLKERLPSTSGVAVAEGLTIIGRDRWKDTPLKDGMSLTVITATRGG